MVLVVRSVIVLSGKEICVWFVCEECQVITQFAVIPLRLTPTYGTNLAHGHIVFNCRWFWQFVDKATGLTAEDRRMKIDPTLEATRAELYHLIHFRF